MANSNHRQDQGRIKRILALTFSLSDEELAAVISELQKEYNNRQIGSSDNTETISM